MSKKKKTQVATRIQLMGAQRRAKVLQDDASKLRVQLTKVIQRLQVQKRRNDSLLSDAPDLFDLNNHHSTLPKGDYFIRRGESGWMVRDGEVVSAFRLTEDGIVEQLEVVEAEIQIPSIKIKEIMVG